VDELTGPSRYRFGDAVLFDRSVNRRGTVLELFGGIRTVQEVAEAYGM
jgi:hypothetical protein